MLETADTQASLEAALKGEILRMYEEVAEQPDGDFHFFHGRTAAEMFEYDAELLDRAPESAVASFAGVGNPHLRSDLQPGETVLDLGSGAGLDAIIAAWNVGPTGSVIGVDLNPPCACGPGPTRSSRAPGSSVRRAAWRASRSRTRRSTSSSRTA
jgi:SAM-dependent methyltransferase